MQISSIAVNSVSIPHSSLSSQQPRALPYIGAYLDQIYSLEMNVKTWNTDGLVNFAKMTKVKNQSWTDMVVTASIVVQDDCLQPCIHWVLFLLSTY